MSVKILTNRSKDGTFLWLNGEFCNYSDVAAGILTHGLQYGSSVFEGIVVYDGKIVRLESHIERLLNSAKMLDLDCHYSHSDLVSATKSLISSNFVLVNSYIRPIIWRGDEYTMIAGSGNAVHTAVLAWEWKNSMNIESKKQGIRVCEAIYTRASDKSAPVTAKASCLYATYSLCKRDASSRGYDDAVMLDCYGNIGELTTSNLFFVGKDGSLHTPTTSSCLAGVTRSIVKEIANSMNIKLYERNISVAEISDFIDCFSTGTAGEICRIGSIEMRTSQVAYSSISSVVSLIIDCYKDFAIKL